MEAKLKKKKYKLKREVDQIKDIEKREGVLEILNFYGPWLNLCSLSLSLSLHFLLFLFLHIKQIALKSAFILCFALCFSPFPLFRMQLCPDWICFLWICSDFI